MGDSRRSTGRTTASGAPPAGTRQWNFGDLWCAVERAVPPDAPALRHGDTVVCWGELAARSDALAAALLERGAKPGDKVAFYLHNRPEYLIALGAVFKAGLVHTNVNYRYNTDELAYLLDNSDARFVLFEDAHLDRAAELAERFRDAEPIGWVQAGAGEPAPFAECFAALCAKGAEPPPARLRTPDDLLFIYTGGTTGQPKAVMWRHADLWAALGAGASIRANRRRAPANPEEHARNVAATMPGPVQITACPLMHGTGLLTAMLNLLGGGCCVTLEGRGFSVEELFDTAERVRAESLVIVGDAFARPMLDALDAEPGRWKLDALRAVLSSGVMWSREVKEGLLRHLPEARLVDNYASSEAVGAGASVTRAGEVAGTARFRISDTCRVFTEDHREVKPGSGERGLLARGGPLPLGYYKDPEKSARTFPVIDGVRYSIPGDWCRVEADGSIEMLGRGSTCINSAGEKIHPEEVEEALKTHPEVADALVVGLPDPRFGSIVVAVVVPRRGATPDAEALREHVRGFLAGYKVPKRVITTALPLRGPNGKPDYPEATRIAAMERKERISS